MSYTPADPNWRARIDREFAAQAFMRTTNTSLHNVAPGVVDVVVENHEAISQQYGYVHGGVVGALLDTACGFSTMTLLPTDHMVLTVEYKVNFLRPAQGAHFVGAGRVVKAGRTILVCEAELIADNAVDRPLATMTATMMSTPFRGVGAS